MDLENNDDARLRSALGRLNDSMPSAKASPTMAETLRRSAHRRRRRRSAVPAVMAVLLVTAPISVIAIRHFVTNRQSVTLLVAGEDAEPTETQPSLPATSEPLSPSSPGEASVTTVDPSVESGGLWTQFLPDAGLSSRWDSVTVGFDDGVLVWGGREPTDDGPDAAPRNDGAFYSASTGAWRPTAASPLDGGPTYGVALDTTHALLVTRRQAAIYNVAADTWEDVALPDGAAADIVDIALIDDRIMLLPSGATWRRESRQWEQLPPVPAPIYAPSVVVSGSQVMIYGGDPNNLGVETEAPGVGYVFDANSTTWTLVPPSPMRFVDGSMGGAQLGDEFVFVSSRFLESAAFDPVGLTWRLLPDVPVSGWGCSEFSPELRSWTGGVVYSACSGFALLSASSPESWTMATSPGAEGPVGLELALGGLLIDGALTTSDVPTLIASPELPPTTVLGLTIDRAAKPASSALIADSAAQWLPTGTELRLTAFECLLRAQGRPPVDGPSPPDSLLVAAISASATNPASVAFENKAGRYELFCPTQTAYANALASFRVAGERAGAVDVLERFASLPTVATVEELFEAVTAVVKAEYAPDIDYPALSVGAAEDASWMEISLSGSDDDSSIGIDLELSFETTPDGFRLISAFARTVCARGATAVEPSVCL
jgi:hypothetical protein